MPMINGTFTNLPDDYNRGYSPVPQNYGLAMAVENLRGDNQNLPQSFNDKLNSIAEASLKAAQLKGAMNQQPREDLKSNLQKRLDERKARAVGMSELLKNRTNDEFNKRLYDSYIESKLGPVSKKEDFNGLFSPIPQSLPPPETKTRNTTEPQYTPIPDSYKALVEKDKQSEQPVKAKSAETKPSASAPNRSKDFIERYREAARNATMELDPVSFQSNINVAMRDPVYGNATATGLATGQNLLNSWIAGNNAKARRDKEALSDMRWIKQMEDADEARNYQRKWNEDERAHRLEREKAEDEWRRKRADIEDKRYEDQFFSPGQTFEFNPMNVDNLKKDSQVQDLLKTLGEDVYAKSAAEKAVAENRKAAARKKLELLSEAANKSMTTQRPTKEQLENYGTGLYNFLANWGGLNVIDWDTRAETNATNAMKNAGYRAFSDFNPTAYLKEAENNIRSGNIELGVQQKKIYDAVRILSNAYGVFKNIKISPDGSTIVVSGPWGSKVITPKNAEAIARQFELSSGE